jgi:uncharacterized protein (TIGR04222 family)
MNPFDLPGPQFLLFYLAFGTVLLFIAAAIRRSREGTQGSDVRLTDPYLIAYLRGGKNEALSVAAISLLDRQLLTCSDKLSTANADAVDIARRPIERAILIRFKEPADPKVLFTDPALSAAAEKYKQELMNLGLLPDARLARVRHRILSLAIFLLWATAIIKIGVALSRGRTNIVFLIALAVILTIVAHLTLNPRRTRSGDALLGDLKTLFGGLKDRSSAISPGGQSNEAAFLAAVFGIGALPLASFPFAARLRPQTQAQGAGGSSCSSWTSSCSSSSCGSSCGGSCGGGCGGCGS